MLIAGRSVCRSVGPKCFFSRKSMMRDEGSKRAKQEGKARMPHVVKGLLYKTSPQFWEFLTTILKILYVSFAGKLTIL